MSFAQAERLKWQDKAEAQDANAQYYMGNSYCCGKSGFFETNKAIDWWCKAAKKGHEKAKKALEQHDRKKLCKMNI